jgi:hypothetical protein
MYVVCFVHSALQLLLQQLHVGVVRLQVEAAVLPVPSGVLRVFLCGEGVVN